MPTTTTAVNAKNVAIFLDDDAGTPVDISGSTNRVTIDISQELGEYAVFGDDWMHRLAGMKDTSIRLRIVYSTAEDEGADLLRLWMLTADASETKRTLKVCVPKNVTGAKTLTLEVLPSSLPLEMDATAAGPIMIEAELRGSGALTLGTVS